MGACMNRETVKVRTVPLEILRRGPAHNQLMSPLTDYLAICGAAGAATLNLPYEHAEFERRLAELRYEAAPPLRLEGLRQTGVELGRMLAVVPGLARAVSGVFGDDGGIIHLRITLSAAELALLPFELSKVPSTIADSSEAWLALQTQPRVCITRHIRTVSSEGVIWPRQPRVLFATGPTADIPFEEHLRALEDAIAPFQYPGRDDKRVLDERHWYYGELMCVIKDASLDDIVSACQVGRFTHVHVLAHGVPDATSSGRPFGLSLRGRHGLDVVSGDRFANAIASVGNSVHRPSVVTIASCDLGLISSVVEPVAAASFAHAVHQAGIPLVVASQFPLTKEGSVLMVGLLYEGLLSGENPWVLFHRLRGQLHSRLGAFSHDWASLVIYEALPSDISGQLEEFRFHQGRARLNISLERVDRAVSVGNADDLHHLALVADVGRALDALHSDGAFALECLALRGSAYKRLAQASYTRARGATDGRVHLDESCRLLEQALAMYGQAAQRFLLGDTAGARPGSMLHWFIEQEVSLRAVLGRPFDRRLWEVGVASARAFLNSADLEQRAWAHASLAELWLLRLTAPARTELGTNAAIRLATDYARRLAKLYPWAHPWPIKSTWRQFQRYTEWWGERRFAEYLQSRQTDWNVLIDTAGEIVRILKERRSGEATAPPPPPFAPAVASTPAPDPETMRADLSGGAPVRRRRARGPRSATFLDVHMLPAQHGDCLWIEYGEERGPKSRVLVDCGTRATNRHLMARIDALPEAERKLELFVMTHIDDDHIGGAIPFLEGHLGGVHVDDVWFNGWRHLSDFLGAKQGERFSTLLADLRLPWNQWRSEKSIVVDNGVLPEKELPGGLRLTLLSPTAEKLEALGKHWEKELDRFGLEPGARMLGTDDEDEGGDSVSTDVDELVERPFKSDKRAPNGSSIALLAEFEGKSVLLGADAHPAVLIDSIGKLLRKRGADRLKLDAFKVAHHASHGNTSPELLQLLECPRYLISTNGDKFKHPHSETIARLIRFGGPGAELCFNYISDYNKVWSKKELQDRYRYRTRYPETSAPGLVVRL